MNRRPSDHRPLGRLAPLACVFAALACGAARAEETIVVTGSIVQRKIDEAPYAITAVEREALRSAGPMINLSEALARVPGLVVNNRSNYAQDLQISSRGFGARAGFGVRGLRLVADGIPASGPDGQGQVSHVDIAGAQRVEVLRGPFSVLYGNSSGGVIAVVGAAATRTEFEGELDAGSFGLRQLRFGAAAPLGGGFDLRAGASTMSIDGFRPHSAADKRQAHLRGGWRGARDTVTVLLNALDQPSQDPLGLTRAQFDLGPQETASVATRFDTRKTQRQTQAGVSWRHAFAGDGALRESTVSAFGGARSVTQWLAIEPGTQNNLRHGGGVVDFDRRFDGIDMRLRWAVTDMDFVAGVAQERQRDDRKGYNNYTGTVAAPVLGVVGTLRRDELNFADTRDVYAQADWALTRTLNLSAGVRIGRVDMSSRDQYLSNGNDSGAVSFDYANPVLGLRWQLAPGWQAYASHARGFESPTLGELAYRADGTGGFNAALRPQTSRQFEIGSKWSARDLALEAVHFEARTDDEIGVSTNAGGRSAFQNVGRTLRRGIELALDWRFAPGWRAQAALGQLQATYRDGFLTCAGIPCAAPTVPVPAGNRIAGAPRGTAWGEVAWRDATWGEWGLELRGAGRVAVNDRNSDFASGYGLTALRWSRTLAVGDGMRVELLARVDNLADRAYAGSVIVNDANGRVFEPGAPRSALLAVRLTGTR
jgi:iron complex outermembrane recepter protein